MTRSLKQNTATGMETETKRLYENCFFGVSLDWLVLGGGDQSGTHYPQLQTLRPWESPLETIHFLSSSKLIKVTFGKRSVFSLAYKFQNSREYSSFPPGTSSQGGATSWHCGLRRKPSYEGEPRSPLVVA